MPTPDPTPRSPRPSTWLGASGLLGLCLVVYLPGFFALPPVDRDESRFAQASRQMLESVTLPAGQRDAALHSGGLIVPKVQGRDRLNKPPLIYWLQAASAAVFTAGNPLRDAIWMYRVPSLLAAIAAVLLTWRIGASMFDARTGRLAAALLACCPVVAWEARQARSDMVLLAVTTAAMGAMWMVWGGSGETERRRDEETKTRSGVGWAVMFWVALAAGVLVKGPITPLVAGLAALSLCLVSRRWWWLLDLRPVLGVFVLAALVSPWVVAVGNRVGWQVYLKTITDETLGRSLTSREGHWGPPGYHTLLLPILFWPGSLMTAAGIALAFRQGLTRSTSRDREGADGARESGSTAPLRSRLVGMLHWRAGHAPYLFCLSWIVPAWLVFEIVSTKLPHYTLPMYPAIALLSARAVLAADARLLPGLGSRAAGLGRGLWVCIGGGLVVLIPLALAAADFSLGPRRVWFAALAVVLAIVGVVQLVAARHAGAKGLIVRGQLAGLAAFVAFAAAVIGFLLPRSPALWISPRLIRSIASIDPGLRRPIASVGFHEDSLLFLTRGRAQRIGAADIGAWFHDHPDGIAVVPHPLGVGSAEPVATIKGFNYSKGRVETYAVIRAAP